MNSDPLKLLAEISRRGEHTSREHAVLARLFDREIAALLRKRRLTLGLTQPQYAERTGLKVHDVVRVEIRGRCPRIEDLYASAKILNPANEESAWLLAVELQRQAAKRLLERLLDRLLEPQLSAAA